MRKEGCNERIGRKDVKEVKEKYERIYEEEDLKGRI